MIGLQKEAVSHGHLFKTFPSLGPWRSTLHMHGVSLSQATKFPRAQKLYGTVRYGSVTDFSLRREGHRQLQFQHCEAIATEECCY